MIKKKVLESCDDDNLGDTLLKLCINTLNRNKRMDDSR